jgi:short-subunit dehydrogenase/MoaA/NifB/PqqE/SkfB family radical SAM enzyme
MFISRAIKLKKRKSMEKFSFNGKHVLITGASGGLGSALVRRLAEMGADLVVSSRSMRALKELISSLPETTRTLPVTADLSEPAEAGILAQKSIEALGFIDVLINNAGIGYFALMEEATEENIRHLFEVNMFSPLALIKALLPHMKARGRGRIINIVSCAGRVPIPTVGVYGGSKSALAIMANTMRLELEPAGIDILNIYPGTVDTSFEENALREEKRPGLCPMDNCGLPKFEVAEQVLKASVGPPGEVWLERPGKWLSTASIVWPKHVEKHLKPIRDKVVQTKSLKQRRWQLFQVESSIGCNLRCIMCPWEQIRDQAENRGLMSAETWAAIRPYLTEVRSIDFTGGGEPLLQPHLTQWISEAKSAGCDTGILTNGVLLKKEISRKLIDAGLDWVCVSMDGATADVYEEVRKGSNFKQVCDNLENIAKIRSGKIPKMMINFVLMPVNAHQVEEIIQLANCLGVDQVNFKQCDVIRGDHGKGFGLFAAKETKEIRHMEKELAKSRRIARKLKIHTTTFSFTPEEQPVCDQDPRNSLFIRYDGKAAPCINQAYGGSTTFLGDAVTMPTVHYGRLPGQDIMDLWQTETCEFFKERFQQRVVIHDEILVKNLIGGSSSGRERALKAAVESMPEPPEGCRVCHYLYNI